ncbi:MAG: GGDEF domain-containing protein [Pseudomonadota bacterium]
MKKETTTSSSQLGRYLVVGFLLLIVLMAGLVGHAIWQFRDLASRMGDIVDLRNRKIQLATDLLEASYNRHNTLVYQTLTRDSFERDGHFQLYIKWGYQVGKARNDLKLLPLDRFEMDNLARQDKLVERIIVLHEEISDLAARERLEEARDRLSMELRPFNVGYTEVVEELRRYERDGIRAALESTRQATDQAIALHLGLGVALLLLATLIALKSNRLQTRHARTIGDQMKALEIAGDQLEHEATHDPLTGLANRALFYRRLQEGLAHASQENFQMGVLYVDLDDFKLANDTHGHAAGDAILKAVASRLKACTRVSDTVARLGGDEFALILSGLESAEFCTSFKHKLEEEVTQPLGFQGMTLLPHCSVGYALYPRDASDLEGLLHAADSAMYRIKRERKAARNNASEQT